MTSAIKQQDVGRARISLTELLIHNSDTFHASHVDKTMGDGDIIVLGWKTSNTEKFVHLVTLFASKAGGHLEIFEGSTWGRLTNQTTVNIIQHNRNQTAANNSGVLENSTQTAYNAGMKMKASVAAFQSLVNGTLIFDDYVFGTANKGGGAGQHDDELILKKDTQYLAKYTADGASNGGFIRLEWYEYIIVD